jgi:hypothetical protein
MWLPLPRGSQTTGLFTLVASICYRPFEPFGAVTALGGVGHYRVLERNRGKLDVYAASAGSSVADSPGEADETGEASDQRGPRTKGSGSASVEHPQDRHDDSEALGPGLSAPKVAPL